MSDNINQAENDFLRTKLIKYFVRDNQYLYADITDALEKGDIKLAHRLVHSLKSSAGQLGEKRLQEIAEIAEMMLHDGKNLLSEEHKKLLETELNATLTKLTPLAEAHTPPPSKIDDSKTKELFDKLETMLKDNNPECMFLVNDLRSIAGTEKIIELIEDFEFDKALEELNSKR